MNTMTISLFLFLFLFSSVQANQSNPSRETHNYLTPPSKLLPPPVITHILPTQFFQHFQQSHLHIPAKYLHADWGKVAGSLTLEKILSANVTTPGEGPLRLNYDVTLHKVVNAENGRRRQTVEKISESPIVPASVTSALEDGFALTIHRVAHRVAVINSLAAGLAKSFRVRITTDYTIHPGEYGAKVSAQDEIHIIMSGSCTAEIYEGVVRYPFEQHIEEFDVDKDMGNESVKVDLAEGDFLYIPRGDELSVSDVSMLTIRLHTDDITHADVLKALMDVANVVEDSPLSDSLPRSEGVYSYGDLLKALVNVAAVVTEDLRKHFVVGEDMYEDDDDESIGIVSDISERFLGAAHALLKPGMEVLSEGTGIGEWIREIDDDEDVAEGFERCVEWLKTRDLAEICAGELFVKWFERREREEAVELRSRWEGLRKYGEPLQWVEF